MIKPAVPSLATPRALVDQQLWYLGRDIAADAGNGPIRFGFRRIRSTTGCGTSCYLLDTPAPHGISPQGHPRILCWGFGLYIGDAILPDESLPTAPLRLHGRAVRGILLERFSQRPRLTRVPLLLPVHQPAQLTRFESVRDEGDTAAVRTLLDTLALVMVRYERWALHTLGHVHRRSALADIPRHKRHRFASSTELSAQWQALLPDGCTGEPAGVAPSMMGEARDVASYR